MELCAIEVDFVINASERKPADHRRQFERTIGIGAFAIQPATVILPAKPFETAFGLRDEDVLAQRLAGQRAIKALMLESHLVGGRQDLGAGPLTYGQSITDACLGFDETKRAIEALAARLA